MGFLDAKSISFKTQKVLTKKRHQPLEVGPEQNIEISFPLAVCKSYTQLIETSFLPYARQKSLHKTAKIPFSGKSFAAPQGEMMLTMSSIDMKELAKKDTLVKLAELKASLKSSEKDLFDQFPISAQSGLLDLCYNLGHIPKGVKQLALKKDWKELAENPSLYQRSDPSYKKRNEHVQNWFREASKTAEKKKNLDKQTKRSK